METLGWILVGLGLGIYLGAGVGYYAGVKGRNENR